MLLLLRYDLASEKKSSFRGFKFLVFPITLFTTTMIIRYILVTEIVRQTTTTSTSSTTTPISMFKIAKKSYSHLRKTSVICLSVTDFEKTWFFSVKIDYIDLDFLATNQTRTLVRRSSKTDDVLLDKVHVDLYRMAGSSGNVSSVSFYADRTCALATVVFAAFDVISRDVGANTAQLIVTDQSVPLKLGARADLKPYMHLITIRLCTGDSRQDAANDKCQGNRFAVLPHQYIGIYSKQCRFGFAQPPANPTHDTTLVSEIWFWSYCFGKSIWRAVLTIDMRLFSWRKPI